MNDVNTARERPDWLKTLAARARRIHDDEGGQSIVYMALILFLLACFTFMVINSGALIHDKMQVQSAADASVLSGSTWIARGMNLNSMMNIFLAMLLAEEIYMKAVFWTALTAIALSPAIEAFWLGVCFITGTCTPAWDAPFDTFEMIPILWQVGDDEDFIWDIMESLSDVEESVDNVIPVVAELESVRVAMMNGAAFGVMYPPSIPEEQGQLDDLCETTLSGSAGGYNEAQYSAVLGAGALLGSISGFSFASDLRNMAAGVLNSMGLGGPLWGEMQIPYHLFWAETAPYHFTNIMFIMAVSARYGVMCGGGFGASGSGMSVSPAGWCFFCDSVSIGIPNPFQYLGAAFAFLEPGNSQVQPMRLVDDWQDKVNFYGFAYKTPEDVGSKLLPAVFKNSYGDTVGMITVAQAQIYNPHEAGGLFSPHWRTHLTPVTLGSDTADAASGFVAGAGGSGGMLSAMGGMLGGGLDAIIAH